MSQHMYKALPYPFDNLPAPGEAVGNIALHDVALPLLRSIYCTLRSFATTAAHNDVMPEHLALALEVMAGQVYTCAELMDRATQGH